jgi:hypothetical protein
MSYLLFTPKYTNDLIDIGYNDASQRIDEIEDFLYSSDDAGAGSSSNLSGGTNKSRRFSLTRRAPNLVKYRG